MDLLSPCPYESNCWIYTVRAAGPNAGPYPSPNGAPVPDDVAGIARFFGVSTTAIYQMNPWASAGVKPGDKLKIPTPTKWS
jgi:hypothetical protein